jgi:hypothetical protein
MQATLRPSSKCSDALRSVWMSKRTATSPSPLHVGLDLSQLPANPLEPADLLARDECPTLRNEAVEKSQENLGRMI